MFIYTRTGYWYLLNFTVINCGDIFSIATVIDVPYKGAFVVGKDIFVLQGVAVDLQEHFTMPDSLWGAQAWDIHKLDMSLPWTELNLVGLNTLLGNDMTFVGVDFGIIDPESTLTGLDITLVDSDQTKLDPYLTLVCPDLSLIRSSELIWTFRCMIWTWYAMI